MKVTILVMFITIFIAILVYYFIIKNIFKPIYDLVVTSSEIASGNLLRRADIVRNDEIGNLSYAFNYMADRLYEFVENLEVKVKERTTKLESANEELLETKEDLQLILDSTAEGIVGIDMEGRSIFCNDSCIRLLGYHSQEEILGKNIYHVFFQNHGVESHNGVEYPILRALRTGKYLYVDDAAFVRPDGSKLPVEYHSYPKRKEGSVIGAVITFFDTSEKHENQKQIEYLSYHDALTGLMNRRFFEHKLKQLNQEGILPISIIFGDLNGLKLVNDIFGHAAGDKLIVKSAKAIERVCSEKHMVARVGGDEFIVILPGEDEVSTMKIIQRIRDELAKEKIFAVKCSMSLGFDTKRELSQDLEKIVGNAESEMYKEKLINKKSFGQDAIQTMIQEVQSKNPGEAEHSERVAYLCQEMGKAMGLSERDIRRLKDAGYIHDIGKIALEKDIFNSDHLSEAQLEQIRQHPSVGFKILNLFDDTLDLAETVYAHHERWDGTGYPKGLKGEEIPITARVIAIVGKYERMYRTKYFNEKNAKELALSEIKALSGAAFDPDLVVVFSAMMEASEDLK
jgi:diguanylate cyclase (GGDEF)-like protein/PAS domain S-box-containing protein